VKRFDHSMDFLVQALKVSYVRLAQARRRKLPPKMPASKLARRASADVAAQATAAFMQRALAAAAPMPAQQPPGSVIRVRCIGWHLVVSIHRTVAG
jgi:hypothetical protein